MLWCWVCDDYMRYMSVSQSIQFSCSSSMSHPDNIITVIVFLIHIFCWVLSLFHWYYVDYFFSFFSTLLSMTVLDVECSCIGLFVTIPLTVFILLFLVPGCLSSWFKMFSNGSVLICLCRWFQRYCSAEIGVGFMCCLFCVISLPVLVMQMWYNLPSWFWLPFPFIMPWAHSLPSSYWTTTADTIGIETYILGVPLPLLSLVCLFTITS